MAYEIRFTKRAQKNACRLEDAGLKDKALELLLLVQNDPYQNPPHYEKPIGDLSGLCSRRINIKHRLVYQVDEPRKAVKILSMWTHYEGL